MKTLANFLIVLLILCVLQVLLFIYIPQNQPIISDTKPTSYSKSSSFLQSNSYSITSYSIPEPLDEVQHEPGLTSEQKINNPEKAREYLAQLDKYQHIGEESFNNKMRIVNLYNKTFSGLIKDSEYCEKHRNFFVHNTSTFFDERLVFGVYNLDNHVLHDLLPKISNYLNHKDYDHSDGNEPISAIPYKASFLMFQNDPTEYFTVNQEYSCTSQYMNHIIGGGALTREDLVTKFKTKYTQSFENRPFCDDFSKFFIKTWHLLNSEECTDFFENYFNTKVYKQLKKEQTIVYIRKMGEGSQAKATELVNDEEESRLRQMYDNWAACDFPQQNLIIQKYIHNSLLIKGKKFDLRSYMLIASTNPLIAYYADGLLRMADQNLKDFSIWNYDHLANYLMKIGKIQDNRWLEHFRSQMKKVMVHLLRMSQDSIVKSSSMFELFGLDFIMDEELNVFFLECNSVQTMQGETEEKIEFFVELNKDVMDLMYGYLRSRVKRLVKFLNKLTEECPVEMTHLRRRNVQFTKITSNYMDPEFAIKSKYFTKIVDMNAWKTKRYFSITNEECL